DLMRKAGKILGETLHLLKEKVRPGITTTELDRIAEEFITKHGATPSFKGLYGFPASLCISVNNQVIHGFPGSYELKDGDIVSIDCGVCLNGFHSDAARTFGVGNISEE
ncbi:M24 family metallopeptidase, partial [Escherichia coli]|nr:M24 family metallopeptidase [Escherichia coli]